MTITKELIELRKLAEAATQGPWIAGDDEDSDRFLIGPPSFDQVVTNPVVELHALNNAEYIAAANPAKVIELLDHIEALSAEVERLTAAVNYAEHISKTCEGIVRGLTAERDQLRAQLEARGEAVDFSTWDEEDAMFEQINIAARKSFQRHKSSVRGQQITRADGIDSHLVWAALEWAKAHPAPAAPVVEHAGLQDAVEFFLEVYDESDKPEEHRTYIPEAFGNAITGMRTALAALQAAPAQPVEVDLSIESMKLLEGFDYIWADYATTHGSIPDTRMRQVVAQTKDRLLTWFSFHCDAIRAALAQAQAQPNRPINCGTGHCSCIECVMEPAQGLTDDFLQTNDYYLLHRFIETTEDDESYDITKAEIKRLADLGVVQSHGFGKYSVTMFGYWVHERYWEQNPSLPLKTNTDRDAEAAAIQKGQQS